MVGGLAAIFSTASSRVCGAGRPQRPPPRMGRRVWPRRGGWAPSPLAQSSPQSSTLRARDGGPTRTIFLYEIGPHHHLLGPPLPPPHAPLLPLPHTLASTHSRGGTAAPGSQPAVSLAPHAQPARAHQGHARRVLRWAGCIRRLVNAAPPPAGRRCGVVPLPSHAALVVVGSAAGPVQA